jgi:hypothetical protein
VKMSHNVWTFFCKTSRQFTAVVGSRSKVRGWEFEFARLHEVAFAQDTLPKKYIAS